MTWRQRFADWRALRVSAAWVRSYAQTADRNGVEQSVIQQWPIVTESEHDRSATSPVSDRVGVAALETLPRVGAGARDVVSHLRSARGSG